MTKFYLFLFAMVACISDSFAQGIGINDSGNPSDPSAMLDISSTTRGVLINRMTELERLAIPTPATGLLIYQTDGQGHGFWYFDGALWKQSVGPAGALPPGNAVGDMLYWNGSAWVLVPIGQPGQILNMSSSIVPSWISP